MIDKIKKKINRIKEDKDMQLYYPNVGRPTVRIRKKEKKKKKSTQEKKIQRDHASRKSLMIILEASLKKKDETQK